MHSIGPCLFLFVALLVQGVPAIAQGVYVTPGANGPVFSDKPQPGAKAVDLPPINVMTPPAEVKKVPAATDAVGKAAGAPLAPPPLEYRSFSILSPEDNGSVLANTAIFEVRVSVDPALQLGERHAFMVSINGRQVGQRYTATEFMIPPEFWGDTLPPPNQRVQLDVRIVDGEGRVLKQAASVSFYMRYANINNRPPQPRPLPLNAPRVAPVLPHGSLAPPLPPVTQRTGLEAPVGAASARSDK